MPNFAWICIWMIVLGAELKEGHKLSSSNTLPSYVSSVWMENFLSTYHLCHQDFQGIYQAGCSNSAALLKVPQHIAGYFNIGSSIRCLKSHLQLLQMITLWLLQCNSWFEAHWIIHLLSLHYSDQEICCSYSESMANLYPEPQQSAS